LYAGFQEEEEEEEGEKAGTLKILKKEKREQGRSSLKIFPAPFWANFQRSVNRQARSDEEESRGRWRTTRRRRRRGRRRRRRGRERERESPKWSMEIERGSRTGEPEVSDLASETRLEVARPCRRETKSDGTPPSTGEQDGVL